MPPLSGIVGIYGPEIARAAQIACDEVNENGGVLGRALELVIEDDGSLPESAVLAAEKLVDQHHCSAIIGNLLSNSRIAVAYRVAETRKIPLLNFSFHEGSVLSRYFFHFAALPNQQIQQMIPYMREHIGPKMFFAGNNYEWPRGSIDAAKRALLAAGGEILGEEYLPLGASSEDLARLLDAVEKSGADVFVPYFAGEDQLKLLNQFTERGLKDKMSVVMGHYDEVMASQLKPEVREEFYSSNTYFMTVETEENRNFLQRLSQFPGVTGIWPDGNGILTNFGEGAYLCVKAFAKAVNQAGSLESEALIDVLERIDLRGPQGHVEMDPVSHHAKVNTYLSKCTRDGRFEIIETFGSIAPVIPERYQHLQVGLRHLDEDEVRLQARIVNQMDEAVYLAAFPSGEILYTNPGFDQMFGYEHDELIGQAASVLNPPEHKPGIEKVREINRILNETGLWTGESKCNKKGGETLWVSSSISVFTHPKYGEVWMDVLKDVTQRKLAEQAQQQRQVEFQTLWEAATDGMITVNLKGSITSVNSMVEDLFGYARQELVGQPIEILIPEHMREAHHGFREEYQADLYRREMGEGLELFGQRKDGEKLPIEISLTPILMRGQQEVLAEIQDISKRKSIEEQLRQAQKLEAVGELTGGLAHDLNNILTAMMGFTELSKMTLGHEHESFKDLEEVSKAGERAKELISKMLAFSSQQILEAQLLNMNDQLRDIESLLRQLIKRDIELTLSLEPDIHRVHLDPSQLEQTIVNLIVNASDAMREGGNIVVTTSNIELDKDSLAGHILDKPGHYVELSVSDTGTGIAPEVLNRIFEPFYTTKEKGKGTGLGLASVYGIVKQSNGEVTVYSEPGVGSTFKVYFPVANSRISATSNTAERLPLSPGNGTILLVEDDEGVRELTKRMLESNGYTVYDTESAEEALEMIKKLGSVDLVITDIVLLGMSGPELAEELKITFPELSVMFISGFAGKALEYINDMQANTNVLRKPFTRNLLLNKTAQLIQ